MKKKILFFVFFLCAFSISIILLRSYTNSNSDKTPINNAQLVQEYPVSSDKDDYPNKPNNLVNPQPNPANVETKGLSNKTIGWGFKPNSNHVVPDMPANVKSMLEKYSGYYVGDTSSKVLYLTYDEGYENGFTPQILDILKANDVKATFFVVKPYITQNPEIIKRMVAEGHIVGNHTSKHPSMPTRANNVELFNKEFTDTETAYKEVTGLDMPKYFRPPMGEFSEKTLMMTQKLGYKTIFWSFAHKDWDVNNQPSVQQAHDIVLNRTHNGCIILLHAVSKSNTEALDSVIKDLKAQGYRFGTLDELK